jgi:CRP/FNR family transcriptional regulator
MVDETRKEYLRNTPVLSGLSDDELDELVPLVVKRRLKEDTVVFHEGDPASAFYLVKQGRVKIYKVAADGREQVLSILGDGQIFGDVPVFDGGPYPATAATMADTEIYQIKREDFEDFVRRHPEVALKLLRVLGQRLRQSMALIRDLSFKQVPHRLAGLLLRLGRDYGSKTDSGTLIDMKLSRQEIAEIVGTSRETVTRELKKMESAGMLQLKGRKIIIADEEMLTGWAR